MISTCAFNNVNVKNAIESTMVEMYNDTNSGFLNASDKLSQILAYNYQNIDTVLQEFLDLAYFKMLESVGSALLTGQAEIDSNLNYPAQFQSVIDVTEDLGEAITITDTATYARKFMYSYDLASLFRTFKQYDDALFVVRNIDNWVYTGEESQLDHLHCLCLTEKEIMDSSYSAYTIDTLLANSCPYNYFPEETDPFIILGIEQRTKKLYDKSNNNLIIENPVKDILNLQNPVTINEKIFIHIYDGQGQLVKLLHTDQYEIKIDVSQFKQGVYLIRINTGSGNFAGKFVKN